MRCCKVVRHDGKDQIHMLFRSHGCYRWDAGLCPDDCRAAAAGVALCRHGGVDQHAVRRGRRAHARDQDALRARRVRVELRLLHVRRRREGRDAQGELRRF